MLSNPNSHDLLSQDELAELDALDASPAESVFTGIGKRRSRDSSPDLSRRCRSTTTTTRTGRSRRRSRRCAPGRVAGDAGKGQPDSRHGRGRGNRPADHRQLSGVGRIKKESGKTFRAGRRDRRRRTPRQAGGSMGGPSGGSDIPLRPKVV